MLRTLIGVLVIGLGAFAVAVVQTELNAGETPSKVTAATPNAADDPELTLGERR